MAHSASAVVEGYRQYAKGFKIVACIFNRVSREKHYCIVKKAVESKVKIPVLGYLPKNSKIGLPERHLGLQSVQETNMQGFVKNLGSLVEKTIDVDSIIKLGLRVRPLSILALENKKIKGHLFHWSHVTGMPKTIKRGFLP